MAGRSRSVQPLIKKPPTSPVSPRGRSTDGVALRNSPRARSAAGARPSPGSPSSPSSGRSPPTFNQLKEMEAQAKRKEIEATRRAERIENAKLKSAQKELQRQEEMARLKIFKDNLEKKKAAQEDSARAIKKTKQEKQNWQSQGRKDIIAAEEVARKEYERVQLEERRIKSEQARTAKAKAEKEAKEVLKEKKKWQSEGRKDIIAAEEESRKVAQVAEIEESRIKSEQFRMAKEVALQTAKDVKREQEAWQSAGRKATIEANLEANKEYERVQIEESRIKSEQQRAAKNLSERVAKDVKREQEAWQSEGRKATIEANLEAIKEYERVQIEESRIKSEQQRVALRARIKAAKEVKHEKELWQSEGRKEIIAAEQAALKQYEKQLIEEARIKSDQFRVAQAKRAKEDKEVKHEKELWQSEGRKEIIAAEQAALKQYEKQLIEEARIKSEQFRVAQVNRLKEEKAVKAEVQKWRSEGRKEIIASEQAALKQYEKQLIEEARIKSEQYRSAQAARLKAEKEVVRDQQQWQSAGRKDVIEAEALALKQYEKQLIEEARIKSDQFRVAQVNRLKEEKAVKAEVQKWRSEGRKEITERRKEEEKRLAVDSIDAYKAKTVQIAHRREQKAAEEKATRHQRNVHRIEGLRLAKEHHAELELKAKEAAHQATYSGLMNPFDWDLGQQSVQMRIGGSGVTHANPSSPAHNPLMRNGGGEIQPFA